MHWSNPYVGLPWSFAGRSRVGVDCWGLLWLVYGEVLNVVVASYAAETTDAPERAEIAALLSHDRAIAPWSPIELGRERAFDMAVFRRAGLDSHIGIVLEPGRMMHILDGGESYIDRYDVGRWKMKLVGLHRHVEMMDRVHAA